MDSEIQQYAGDILAHPRFQQLRTFCHHGLDNSVYDHSVAVAEAACQIARLMRLSESETTSVVRAALLHDFFGYDWHGERFRRYLSHFSGVHRIAHMHGFIHGHIAADRASIPSVCPSGSAKPLHGICFRWAAMPRTRIAWIVTVADKAVASKEMTAAVGGYVSHAYHKIFA